VLAVGLAGVAGLLGASVRDTSAARDRALASLLADDMHARIELSPGQRAVFEAQAPVTAPDCLGGSGCTPADFAGAGVPTDHQQLKFLAVGNLRDHLARRAQFKPQFDVETGLT